MATKFYDCRCSRLFGFLLLFCGRFEGLNFGLSSLQQAAPSSNIQIHLLGPWQQVLPFLTEQLLPLQLRPCGGDGWIGELEFGEQKPLRFKVQWNSVTNIVNELFKSKEFECTQLAPITPVDLNLQLFATVQVESETMVPRLLLTHFPSCLASLNIVQLDGGHDFIAYLLFD